MIPIPTATLGMKTREEEAHEVGGQKPYSLTKPFTFCSMTNGLSAFVRQLERDRFDSFWLTVDIPTWIGIPPRVHALDDSVPAFHTKSFLDCHERWGKQYRVLQRWGVRRLPDGSAQTGIYGGVDYDKADGGDWSETFFPVQTYRAGIRLPWDISEVEWSFYVGPHVVYAPEDADELVKHSALQMEAMLKGKPQPEAPKVGKPRYEGWAMFLRSEY